MASNYDELRLANILPDSISSILEIRNASAAIDPELVSVSVSINEAILFARIDELPEGVLDLLAWQYHVDIYEPLALPIGQKRQQVRSAILLHRHKGTPWAIRQALRNLGYSQINIVEWQTMNTDPHTFMVSLYPFSETNMRNAERIITEYKPVRSHLVNLEGRLPILELVTPAEHMTTYHSHIPTELYPWPDTIYGGDLVYSEVLYQQYGGNERYGDAGYIYGGERSGRMKYGGAYKYGDIGVKYGMEDAGVPRYGVFEHTEDVRTELRNFAADTVFAPHYYGEEDILYNAGIEYGNGVSGDTISLEFVRELLYDGTAHYGENYQGAEVKYI